MSYEPDPRPAEDAPASKKRTWTRWLGIVVAAAVLILGVVSLVSSLTRRAGEAQRAEIEQLRKTIESEADELESLQADYDDAVKALEKKQSEYDEARAKHDSGVVEDAAGLQSLDQLKASAEQAQADYSAALEAYDASIDAVELNAAGYDEAKTELAKLEPFLGYAAAYEQFISGASDDLPGIAADEWEDEPDAQTWYTMIVFPAATQADVTLPPAVEGFPAAIQALAAEPSAKVQAYDDALAASKEAEAKLSEANTALEAAAKAYADGKAAQKTSAEWLADCEQELERLEKRIQELKTAVDDITSTLDSHRAELKKLESK